MVIEVEYYRRLGILVHDPQLAHAVHQAALKTWGLRNKNYNRWLRMVKELARASGFLLYNPYDGTGHMRILTVRVPDIVIERIDDAARKLGVTRSVVVRLALLDFLARIEQEG